MNARGHFAMLPMSAVMRLRGAALRVYAWHVLTLDRARGKASWSQTRIASRLGLSVRPVSSAERLLFAEGWLCRVDDDRNNGVTVHDPFPEQLTAVAAPVAVKAEDLGLSPELARAREKWKQAQGQP